MTIKRRGARKIADKKIADVIQGSGVDLKTAEKLFSHLSKVAGDAFQERMIRVKRVIQELKKGPN